MNELKEKWNKFVKEPFPEITNKDLEFELISLDSAVAGCIDDFIKTKTLSKTKKTMLKESLADLEIKSKEVDEINKAYFEILIQIGKEVLQIN